MKKGKDIITGAGLPGTAYERNISEKEQKEADSREKQRSHEAASKFFGVLEGSDEEICVASKAHATRTNRKL